MNGNSINNRGRTQHGNSGNQHNRRHQGNRNNNGGNRNNNGGNQRQNHQPRYDGIPQGGRGNTERPGAIMVRDVAMTVVGSDIRVGQNAPIFTATANDFSQIDVLAVSSGMVRIFAAVPSLDTSVCDLETRRFNQEAANLSEDIRVYVISTDLPYAQKRWCGNAGVDRVQTLSDHMNTDFGVKYGCLIKERRYLRRAVFVVDRADRVTYVDYMPSLGEQPKYDDVLAAAKLALG